MGAKGFGGRRFVCTSRSTSKSKVGSEKEKNEREMGKGKRREAEVGWTLRLQIPVASRITSGVSHATLL